VVDAAMELLRQMDASSSSDSEDGVAPEPLGMCCVPVPVVINGPAQPNVGNACRLAPGCWLCVASRSRAKPTYPSALVGVTFVRVVVGILIVGFKPHIHE
jgi:hypothetical protein